MQGHTAQQRCCLADKTAAISHDVCFFAQRKPEGRIFAALGLKFLLSPFPCVTLLHLWRTKPILKQTQFLSMTKQFVLTVFAVLLSAFVAMAQTTEPQTRRPAPAGKTEKAEKKDKSDKIEKAEDRSGGAAFSGKGKGGDKNLKDKDEKAKKAKKAKKGDKKQGGDTGSDKDTQTRPGTQQAPAGKTPNTRKPGDKPAPGTEMKKEEKPRG